MSSEQSSSSVEQKIGWLRELPAFTSAGITIVESREGFSRLKLELEDHYRGGAGTDAVNGAIVAYFFDAILGTASASVWREDTKAQATINMNINYMSLLQAENFIEGEGTVVKQGKSTVFTEGTVFDGEGNPGARATGIYRLFRKGGQAWRKNQNS